MSVTTRSSWSGIAGTFTALLISAVPAAAQDQQDRPCTILCAPELKIEPTFTIEHVAQRHRVEADKAIERVGRETVFELIFALDIPTEIPRIGVTLEAILIQIGRASCRERV